LSFWGWSFVVQMASSAVVIDEPLTHRGHPYASFAKLE
jgi:hypothetical protein